MSFLKRSMINHSMCQFNPELVAFAFLVRSSLKI